MLWRASITLNVWNRRFIVQLLIRVIINNDLEDWQLKFEFQIVTVNRPEQHHAFFQSRDGFIY